MTQFPDIEFKYSWRSYQQRVLDELDAHLNDNHLHIIAPPGSGKTVLGLEVALRLNKPTIIFAPTIAIRNQWVQRFCELFLQTNQCPDWISKDIKAPKFLTVTTYQSLHSACKEDVDEENDIEAPPKTKKVEKAKSVISILKQQNVGTIVVDEAHHLKNAWWKSLTEVKSSLNATIVGLTATPPYDVSYAEWERYIELNGPVDAEISVPELVVSGDLCPHQDYIYFSKPTTEENRKIKEYRDRIQILFNEIKTDPILTEALEKHPIFLNPPDHIDWIYNNLEYYSAILIYLKESGREISGEHLEIIGDRKFEVPKLDFEWLETLLTFYLYKDPSNFKGLDEHREKLTNKLKRGGAMERKSVKLGYHGKINSYLTSSLSKLQSIEKIVDFEHSQLGDKLRMVVLTDYIRSEFLVNQAESNLELNKIGVVPIFETLRRSNSRKIKIGVLTGSLVIIPVSAFDVFKDIAGKYGIQNISVNKLPFDDEYFAVNLTESIKHDLVHIFTQTFQKGSIELIIGTKSLLGEGWDAPSINALVLASMVGSFVLSNQMRGRAIRTQRQNEHKTGNIWHLACLDPNSSDGGEDVQLLRRRFKAFVGVSFDKQSSIENGVSRLHIPQRVIGPNNIEMINHKMLEVAANRDALSIKWHEALEKGNVLTEEIKVPFPKDEDYNKIKSLYYQKTIKHLFFALTSGLIGYSFEALQGFSRMARHFRTKEGAINVLMILGAAGVLIFGRLAIKTFKVYIKYRDISKDVHQIGEALVQSLMNAGIITTPFNQMKVVSSVDQMGSIYCHLEGGTTYEKSTFIKSLQEVIGAVENPRYVIIRKSRFLRIIAQSDFHSVPEVLAQKKRFAQDFSQRWRQLVGVCELVYTRTLSGRKLLLKSRMHSLASEFEHHSERISKWR